MPAPAPRPAAKDLEPTSAIEIAQTGCGVADLFRLLGRSHVMGILYLFLKEDPGPHRFVEIQRRLEMSPNTLTERLGDLVKAGLLTRTAYNEIPPRVDYQATQKAKELEPVFASLVQWARRNDLQPAPADETKASA